MATREFEVLDEAQASSSASPLLVLRNVAKSYWTGKIQVPALRSVSLTLQPGEFVALAGPSGSGKSTLLNICGLLDRPDSGEYHFMEQDVGRLNDRRLTVLRREQIGFVFQGFNLVPVMNVHDNVEFPLWLGAGSAHERRQRVHETLRSVGLEELAKRRPDELSGGQRQRVAIARALVKRPQLVIADEPTANLDTATANQIIDLMHGLGQRQGTTFLIATHDVRMTSRCERVLRIEDGELR